MKKIKTPTYEVLRRHGIWISRETSPSYSTVTHTLYKYENEYFRVTEFKGSNQRMVTNVPKNIGGLYEMRKLR